MTFSILKIEHVFLKICMFMIYTLTVQSLEAEITSMFRPSTAMPLTGRAWATEERGHHVSIPHSQLHILVATNLWVFQILLDEFPIVC